jgi:3-phenylpropionate/cinnamic acid dioxygenase small subunit
MIFAAKYDDYLEYLDDQARYELRQEGASPGDYTTDGLLVVSSQADST